MKPLSMDVSGTIRSILNQKSDEVFSISPDATVLQAVEMMDAKNVGALLVMDRERLAGIISERDYTRKVMLRGKRSWETKVAEIMSSNVTVTHPREPVEKCLRLMTDKHIRHLPVLEDDKVVWSSMSFHARARLSRIWNTTFTVGTWDDAVTASVSDVYLNGGI